MEVGGKRPGAGRPIGTTGHNKPDEVRRIKTSFTLKPSDKKFLESLAAEQKTTLSMILDDIIIFYRKYKLS